MAGPSTPTTTAPISSPSSDPLDILLASDAWATRMLLERSRPLSREQFHQRFEIGLGSLHENLSHIVGVVRRWTDRLAGRTLRPSLNPFPGRPDIPCDAKDRTPDDLLALLEPAAHELAAIARDFRAQPSIAGSGLAGLVRVEWPGKDGTPVKYSFTRGAVLVHICTHGTHHRAQCINMMRQLKAPGLSDNLPDPGVVDWQTQVEMPPSA